ncbi:MAG: efflux RND transporter periplasmic adaptor subunit [Spirochaetales bacterium]|nr:efflux RND transporter periplasmic adaptor subunit [Spirochaetales bacterium]
MRRYIFFLIIVVFSCKEQSNDNLPIYAVETIKPIVSTIYAQKDSSGILEPENVVKLTNSISGYVKKIYVKENQLIDRDETFIEIENKDLDIELLQIESQLRSAEIQLKLAQNNYIKALTNVEKKMIQLSKSEIEIKNKQLELELASQNTAKAKELFVAGAISDEEMEKIIFSKKMLESSLILLQKEFEVQQIGYRDIDIENFGLPLEIDRLSALQQLNTIDQKAQIRLAEENISSIKNNLKILEINREKLRIKATCDGVIFGIKVCEGELIQSGTQIASILETKNLKATFRLPLNFAKEIKRGQKIKINITGMEEEIDASFLNFTPEVDPVTTTLGLQIFVDNSRRRLRPGMFFTTKITGNSKREILTLPFSSIIDTGKAKFVFIVEKGYAFLKEVELSGEDDDQIIIESGITKSDIVIDNPPPNLNEGAKIDIK